MSRELHWLQAGSFISLLLTASAASALIISDTIDVRRREIVSTALQEAMGAFALAVSAAFAAACIALMALLTFRRLRAAARRMGLRLGSRLSLSSAGLSLSRSLSRLRRGIKSSASSGGSAAADCAGSQADA